MNLSRLFAPITLVSAIALSGISGSALADTTLRIGVTPVPHADIVNFIKPTLEKEGVKLEVVEFNDYIQPNLALDAGELDAPTISRRFRIWRKWSSPAASTCTSSSPCILSRWPSTPRR